GVEGDLNHNLVAGTLAAIFFGNRACGLAAEVAAGLGVELERVRGVEEGDGDDDRQQADDGEPGEGEGVGIGGGDDGDRVGQERGGEHHQHAVGGADAAADGGDVRVALEGEG